MARVQGKCASTMVGRLHVMNSTSKELPKSNEWRVAAKPRTRGSSSVPLRRLLVIPARRHAEPGRTGTLVTRQISANASIMIEGVRICGRITGSLPAPG